MTLLACALALAGALPASALELTIYHTNDVHGWILARPAKLVAEESAGANDRIGGMAALAAYLGRQKGPRLLLDAGDWYQGTPEGDFSKGAFVVDLMNALGYDALEVGNHDFDFGRRNLEALIQRAKMPVLGANVYDEASGARAPFVKPWIVKDVSGVKVGIFGLLTTAMPRLSKRDNYAGLSFRPELDEARDAVKALRAQGATVIVALTHVGFRSKDSESFTDDKAIAAAVPGIDLIVGGHTHTVLKEPWRDPKNGTLVVQAGHALTRVGRVVLEIDDASKKVVSSKGELVSLWQDRGEDAAVAGLIEAREPELRKIYDVAIATAAQPLRRNRRREAPLGDWMADCEREWAGADVAIQGYVPADMAPGPVTLRSMLDVMPFDNRLVKLSMRGSLVREAFDRGVDARRTLISVSGAAFSFDRDRREGSRISAASVAGRPLEPEKAYTVVTDDFSVRDSGGRSPFAKADKEEFTDMLERDVLAECARRQRVVTPPPGGRLTNVGEAL